MIGILKSKRTTLAIMFVVLVVTVVSALLVRRFTAPSGEQILTSCANHTVQLKGLIITYAEGHERFPEGTNARTAVAEMNDTGVWPRGWESWYSSACPESFLRDKSIGYIYVGGGLPTKAPVDQPPLMFFCPADSHQRLGYRGFAVMGDGMRYRKSNAEMIALLRAELERAKGGAVPYSAGALLQIRHELASREKHESALKPNQPVERMASGGRGLQLRASWAAATAHFFRSMTPPP